MNKYSIFTFFAGCLFIILLFSSLGIRSTNDIKEIGLPQLVKAINFDHKTYHFAGEAVPLTLDCKERLDRELLVNSYWHSSTIQYLKLSHRFFPIIDNILKEYGIPGDFKFLALAESGLRNLSSPANAKGYWMFRKLAAKELGLEVNDEVDERYHIEKSTRAACEYILKLKNRFGTWTNAAAAYNMGPTAFRSSIDKQRESNYYNMNLSEETMRYVFRIVAIKEIYENPQQYGFYVDNWQKYAPLEDYYEVTVDSSVSSWGDFAHNYGITYRELKRINPWLIDNHLTVIKNTYQIKIPKKD